MFVAPAGVVASTIAGNAAWKHSILEAIALNFSSWVLVYKAEGGLFIWQSCFLSLRQFIKADLQLLHVPSVLVPINP
jgi:hypothetical protein